MVVADAAPGAAVAQVDSEPHQGFLCRLGLRLPSLLAVAALDHRAMAVRVEQVMILCSPRSPQAVVVAAAHIQTLLVPMAGLAVVVLRDRRQGQVLEARGITAGQVAVVWAVVRAVVPARQGDQALATQAAQAAQGRHHQSQGHQSPMQVAAAVVAIRLGLAAPEAVAQDQSITTMRPLAQQTQAAGVVDRVHQVVGLAMGAMAVQASSASVIQMSTTQRFPRQVARPIATAAVITFIAGRVPARLLSEDDMAHFAELDANNIVQQVVVVHNNDAPTEQAGIAFLHGLFGPDKRWVQCSYSATIRGRYPGPGYTYDQQANVFIAPRPFPSWDLNADHDWIPSVAMPGEGEWQWDEGQLAWVAAT